MGDKAAIDATGLLPIPHSHRWDILADGLDPIIESMEGFDKALFARVKSLKWLHHSSHSLGGLFADVWNKTIKLDTGRVQRREAVRVWFQQHDLAAVASEVDERRRNLIESLQTWQEQARPTVEWNENTISVLKQVPNSGGIEWPESEPPELIDYLGEDHSDSLRNICGKVAELVTYLKMQRGTVARRLAESQQSEKTIPPVDDVAETIKRVALLIGGDFDKIMAVVSHGEFTTAQKLHALGKLDERFKGYKSKDLAELLDVSESSIRNGDVWREWNPKPAKRAKSARK